MIKNKAKYLIIGNSAGGIGAAEGIRAVDKQGTIGIITDEPYLAYSRPLISHYLAEPCPVEELLYRPADFYEKSGIDTFLGKKVQQIDATRHSVLLTTGEKIYWEKLLLATGGSPIMPRIDGIPRSEAFSFTTLDDAKAIDNFLRKLSQGTISAVVVGGGLIGVSVTEALVKRGVKVTIVEMRERILNTILDEYTSTIAAEALQLAGVSIITGSTVTAVKDHAEKNIITALLGDGREISCNLIIIAIGVVPRAELAASADIKVNRGVLVDRHMATSIPGIYSCGDAAEAYDYIYGEARLAPIWPNAYLGGRVAGTNMAGIATEYPGGTSMNSLQYFGLDIVSAGIVNPANNQYEVITGRSNGSYRKMRLKDGLIMGMVISGMVERSGIVYNLMKDRVNTDNFKKELISADFGLACLPEEIWRTRLQMQTPALDTSKCIVTAGKTR